MDYWIIILRFVIIFIFAALFGLQRQRAHKPIGFGTFIFVSVGSCGLAISAMLITPENPLPLLGAIITGIGFLGAGALIKTSSDKIYGFTSAAGVWIFAIIGVAIGLGYYFIGSLMYCLVWLVLFIDQKLEKEGLGSYQKRLSIIANRHIDQDDLVLLLRTNKYKLISLEINRNTKQTSFTLLVEGSRINLNQIPKRLDKTDWIESFKME